MLGNLLKHLSALLHLCQMLLQRGVLDLQLFNGEVIGGHSYCPTLRLHDTMACSIPKTTCFWPRGLATCRIARDSGRLAGKRGSESAQSCNRSACLDRWAGIWPRSGGTIGAVAMSCEPFDK